MTAPLGPRLLPDGPEARAEAVRALRDGAVVALPTDTVYGIAVALSTRDGIERLFAVKARPPDRAVALLLAEPAQAEELGVLGPAARALAEAFWPGGLTLVVPRREDRPLPVALTGGDGPEPRTVGVRVPDHPAPRALAAGVGPLPTTSANRSGEPEARDAAEIATILGPAVAVIIDGGPAHGGPASTVVDVSGAEPRILRAGAVGVDELSRVLRAAGLPEPRAGGVGR